MDHDVVFKTDNDGKCLTEVVVFPDADVSEPDVFFDEDDVSIFENTAYDECLEKNSTFDTSNEDIFSTLNYKKTCCLPSAENNVLTSTTKFSELKDLIIPVDYFKYFVTNDLLETIVLETNLYAIQKNSNFRTDTEEIKKYFGVIVIMGIVKMPRYRCYWSKMLNYPVVTECFSRNRFEDMTKYLHFVNNDTIVTDLKSPEYDKFAKVRPLLNYIREACMKVECENKCSIDEQIIPFKGKCKAKQYIPNKPNKWGFKMFARCGVNGLVYDFHLYDGSKPNVQNSCGLVSGDFVIKLCESLPPHEKYYIYFDNWFTSIPLQIFLKNRNIYSVGTIRSNRVKGSTLMTEKELKKFSRGSYDYTGDDEKGIFLTRWFDSSVVTFSSTHSCIEPVSTITRFDRSKKKIMEITCPAVVFEYNKNMGGVDLSDMLMSLYVMKHKCRKYYHRIFYWALNTSIVNAWILYKRNCTIRGVSKVDTFDLLDFSLSIAENLIYYKKTNTGKKRGRPSQSAVAVTIETDNPKLKNAPLTDQIRFDNVGHYPKILKDRARCRVCQMKTRISCMKCNSSCCLTNERNCFYEYHKTNK